MNFKRINNITGWLVFGIAAFVYLKTMEATGSFWDCGEFASCAYKIQLPHPPGAPLFVLIGRLFMAPLSPDHAVLGINTVSALASAFTILFLFWSITHFARKMFFKNLEELNNEQLFTIMAAGAVGALAYTFSDAFWYSAVESEVYGMSSFFTALVVWILIKWEVAVTEEQKKGIIGRFTSADRWLILLFYCIGLSVGVHLLSLLTVPAVVMLYYFKRYKVTTWGTIFAFFIGCVVTGTIQVAVIQWTVKWAGDFDIFFVNSLGLPFFTGFAFFFVLTAALIYFGLKISEKKNWNFLRLGLWSFAFMLIGYSTYVTTLIRSNADVAIDMYNVDNPVNLVGYLSRDQYGDTPLLWGQDFTAEVQDTKSEDVYIKSSSGKYEQKGKKVSYIYADEDQHFFPRMWDQSNEQGHADYYASFAGITKDQKTGAWSGKPTMGDNINFFWQYQLGWMYWRYFAWNFVGKQNDIQGVNMGNPRDGNWLSGIPFIDNIVLGNQSMMPDSMKYNKSNNKLFFLPMILGILGLFYQYKKDPNGAIIVGLLFFFTGLAIAIYLNMQGNQPRERDYAFAGSFYAYAFWIGLGVIYVKDLFAKFMNSKMANYAAALICLLAVPILMANQEWDDHDRGHKTLARDLAKDYLESCDSNAVLITFGDNDTYPLWYAQEVEGIRRDIRVINSSLLGTDWYINDLRYKINKSDPIDPIWTAAQIEGAKRDAIVNYNLPGVDPNKPMDLYTMMKDYAGSDDQAKMVQARDGSYFNVYPTKKVFVPVDIDFVRKNGTVTATDNVVSSVDFEIPKNQIYKNDAAILNIIASNKWKRPIYFTSNYRELGFGPYLRQDGLTYRLVPVKNCPVNQEKAFNILNDKFVFGNCNVPGVYFDEENRRHLNSIRMAYADIAKNLADSGKKEQAKILLERCDKNMLNENFPYGMVSRYQQHNYISIQFLQACYAAGDSVLADKVYKNIKKDLEQQLAYYAVLSDSKQEALGSDIEQANNFLKGMQQIQDEYKMRSVLVNSQAGKPATDSTSKAIKK